MAEISDHDLAVKNRAVQLLDRMISDPKDGLSMKRKIKELVPEANFPELSIIDSTANPILARQEELNKQNEALKARLDKWEQSQIDTREEGQLQSQLDGIQKQYGFTHEGMQKVIDRMKSKNNPDAEAAAAWVASQERKAKPIKDSISQSNLNLFGSNEADEDFKELNLNPEKWAVKTMESMMHDWENEAA